LLLSLPRQNSLVVLCVVGAVKWCAQQQEHAAGVSQAAQR
jgi:hypothetical protein